MELLREWVKPRTVFALMIYSRFTTTLIDPDTMIAAFSTIIGFHFGAKKAVTGA